MKKLIYLFNGRLPTEKAHGVQVVRTCEAFARQGIDVDLIVPFRLNHIHESIFEYYGFDQPERMKIKKVGGLDLQSFDWIPSRLQFHIQNLVSLFFMITNVWKDRHDCGHVFYARDYATQWGLAFFGFNFIAEIHDYRLPARRWYVDYICRHALGIVVNSEGTMRAMLGHYDIPEDRMIVAPNGVALDFFAIPETKAEAREKLGLPQDKIIVAYVGRAESAGVKKGFDLFVKAMSEITDPNVIASAIGVEPPNHSHIRHAQALHREIPLYLRAVDIVVIPLPRGTAHATTTSPIKLFEFLAAGKAIVASDLPSLRKYLDEKTAVFFNPEKLKELKEKIVDLSQNSGQRAELERHALARAGEYTWEHRAKKILNFINESSR